MVKMMQVTLVKSRFGRRPKHRATLAALKLRKIGSTVSVPMDAMHLGLVKQVAYLVSVQS